MTDCSCSCSTFGPDTHDADARHPNPKACIHAETTRGVFACDCCPDGDHKRPHLDPRPELDKIIDPSLEKKSPVIANWRDEDGSIYFTVERS